MSLLYIFRIFCRKSLPLVVESRPLKRHMNTGLGNVFLYSLGLQLAHVAILISVCRTWRWSHFYLMIVFTIFYDMYAPPIIQREISFAMVSELPWDQPSESCQEYTDWLQRKTYLPPWKKVQPSPLGRSLFAFIPPTPCMWLAVVGHKKCSRSKGKLTPLL